MCISMMRLSYMGIRTASLNERGWGFKRAASPSSQIGIRPRHSDASLVLRDAKIQPSAEAVREEEPVALGEKVRGRRAALGWFFTLSLSIVVYL